MTVSARLVRQVVSLYQKWVPIADIVVKTRLTQWRVKAILRGQGVMRPKGRTSHSAWRPALTPEEVDRRKAIGAVSTTWEEYANAVGGHVVNPKLDRRFGVRLLCWRCRKYLSTTHGPVPGDPSGAHRPLCGRCKRVIGKEATHA